jgi:hypothetical protein
MDELEKLMDLLAREQLRAVEDMSGCDSLEERKLHSEVVLNLSNSLSNILQSAYTIASDFGDESPFED